MRKIRVTHIAVLVAILAAVAGVCLGTVGILWTRVFDSRPGDDTTIGIAGLPGGGSVVLGQTFASGTRAIWYDPYGTTVGSTFLSNRDLPVGPWVSSSGGVFVGGRDLTFNHLFVARYDASGGTVWDNTFDLGGNVTPMCLAVDNAGNVVVAGNLDVGNDRMVFVLKVDGAGNKVWLGFHAAQDSQVGTPASTEIYTNHSLAVGPSGDVFVGCSYADSALDDELIVLKFDRDTGDVESGVYGGPGDQKGLAVAVAVDGEIYVAGRTRNPDPYKFLVVRFRPDLTVLGAATKPGADEEALYVTTGGADNVFAFGTGNIVKYRAGDADTDPVELWTFADPEGGTSGGILPVENSSLLALANRGGASIALLAIHADGLAYDNVATYSAQDVAGRGIAVSGNNILAGGDQGNGTDRDMWVLSVGEELPPPGSSGGGGGCFVSTAAWGSSLAPEVSILRLFRDRYLLTTDPGRALVGAYYRVSPAVASRIEGNDLLKAAARFLLVPAVLVASVFVNTGGIDAIVIFGTILVFGAGSTCRGPGDRFVHGCVTLDVSVTNVPPVSKING